MYALADKAHKQGIPHSDMHSITWPHYSTNIHCYLCRDGCYTVSVCAAGLCVWSRGLCVYICGQKTGCLRSYHLKISPWSNILLARQVQPPKKELTMPGDPPREIRNSKAFYLREEKRVFGKLYNGRVTPRIHAMLYECITAWTPTCH